MTTPEVTKDLHLFGGSQLDAPELLDVLENQLDDLALLLEAGATDGTSESFRLAVAALTNAVNLSSAEAPVVALADDRAVVLWRQLGRARRLLAGRRR